MIIYTVLVIYKKKLTKSFAYVGPANLANSNKFNFELFKNMFASIKKSSIATSKNIYMNLYTVPGIKKKKKIDKIICLRGTSSVYARL